MARPFSSSASGKAVEDLLALDRAEIPRPPGPKNTDPKAAELVVAAALRDAELFHSEDGTGYVRALVAPPAA